MDAATIDAARLGSRAARTKLLEGLQDSWYRLCLGMLRDPDAAREATQETAVRFLHQLPRFRGDSQIRTWSLGIAINVVREIRRRRTGAALPEDEAGGSTSPAALGRDRPGPAETAESAEQQENLRAVLQVLPDRQREALLLRFFEDLSVEQTAQVMQCAPGTVKATVHQALATLRKKLAPAPALSTDSDSSRIIGRKQ